MLKLLEVKNICSIKERVSLDFSKGKYTYKENMLCNNGNNTNPHAIFGANGSGKTVLLRVLDKIQQMMNYPIDQFSPFIPYLSGGQDDFSEVKLIFEYEGNSFTYELQTHFFHFSAISIEVLTVDNITLDRKNKKYVVKKDGNTIHSGELDGDLYSAIRKVGVEEHQENSPLELIKSAYTYLSSITYIDVRGDIFGNITQKNKIDALMVKDSDNVNKLLEKYNNFPVYELRMIKLSDDNVNKGIQFRRKGSEVYLPEFLMSNGMRAHSKILTVILNMKPGTLLVIDELERSLHPFVARQFIEELNKNFQIQLIFSSHNTNLLQVLRPDQIFFSKWSNELNQSTYYKLSDAYPSIREVNNIEKMYFGGLLDD